MGYIDDLRVYGRVLSASSVQKQVFAKLKTEEEVALVGYYTFDLGSQPGLQFAKYVHALKFFNSWFAYRALFSQTFYDTGMLLLLLMMGIKVTQMEMVTQIVPYARQTWNGEALICQLWWGL